MLGWLSDVSGAASLRNRARRWASAAISGDTILSATVRPTFVSRARYRSPIPPEPIWSSTLYWPIVSIMGDGNYTGPVCRPSRDEPFLRPSHKPKLPAVVFRAGDLPARRLVQFGGRLR